MKLFQEVVHTTGAKYYQPEQINAWAPQEGGDRSAWLESLTQNMSYVVEAEGVIIGFGDMTSEGHIERMYVHPKYQGQGVARSLMRKFEDEAKKLGLHKLTTDASVIAMPLLKRFGYEVMQEYHKIHRGVSFTNYLMEKKINPKSDATKPCSCHSGKQYALCCQPFHEGKMPDTALQLMRSRFAAYALCIPEYIIHTTHPANVQFCQDTQAWTQQISEFSLHTEFRNLEILEFQEMGSVATVTFVAHLFQDKKDVSFTEKSSFEKVKGKWLYRSGQLSQGRKSIS